jgi:hypothetical protein
MRKVILLVVLAAATAGTANATTWVATCNDGKNVQYVQTVNGAGYLYLKTGKDFYQTAHLSQTLASDRMVCGMVEGNTPAGAAPIMQVCMDQSRQAILLKYSKPGTSGGATQDAGEFCAATVTLRATNLEHH